MESLLAKVNGKIHKFIQEEDGWYVTNDGSELVINPDIEYCQTYPWYGSFVGVDAPNHEFEIVTRANIFQISDISECKMHVDFFESEVETLEKEKNAFDEGMQKCLTDKTLPLDRNRWDVHKAKRLDRELRDSKLNRAAALKVLNRLIKEEEKSENE